MLCKSQVQSGIRSHNNIRGDNNSLKQPLRKIVLSYIHVLRTGVKISAHYDWKNEFLMSIKYAAFFIITNTCTSTELFMSRTLYIELSTWKLRRLIPIGTARPFFPPSRAVIFFGESTKVGGRKPWPLISQTRAKKERLIAG